MYYVLEYKDFSDNEVQQLPRPIIPGDDDSDLAFDNGVIVPSPPARIRFSMTADEKGDLAHTLGIYLNKGKTPEQAGTIKESGY